MAWGIWEEGVAAEVADTMGSIVHLTGRLSSLETGRP